MLNSTPHVKLELSAKSLELRWVMSAAPPTAPSPPYASAAGPAGHRALGAVVALVGLGPLLVGAGLTPSADGHGTHTQMGLPSCGWVMAFDKPCPTCGMTTAVTHTAHGDLVGGFLAQPAGFAFALLASVAFWCGLHGLVSGAGTVKMAGDLFKGRTWWIIGGILLAAWAYKLVTFGG